MCKCFMSIRRKILNHLCGHQHINKPYEMPIDEAMKALGHLVDKHGTLRKREALEAVQRFVEKVKKGDQ